MRFSYHDIIDYWRISVSRHTTETMLWTLGNVVVLYNMNALSTSATSMQLIVYRALCLKTGHNNVTCRWQNVLGTKSV